MALSKDNQPAGWQEGTDLGHADLQHEDRGRGRREGAHPAPALSPSTPPPAPPKEVPTFEKFVDGVHGDLPRNQEQAVRGAEQEVDPEHHLLPAFGGKQLDVIQQREIENYKVPSSRRGWLRRRSTTT